MPTQGDKMKYILGLLLAFFTLPVFGQNLLVDGFSNPTSIDTNIAYRFVIDWTQLPGGIGSPAKEAAIFSSQSDITAFQAAVTAQFSAIKAQADFTKKGTLTTNLIQTLAQNLSIDGSGQLADFVYTQRSFMQEYGYNGTNSVGYSTYFVENVEEPGDPGSYWDGFDDFEGYSLSDDGLGVNCSFVPVSTTLTYDGTSVTGKTSGNYSSVTQDVANGVTSPPNQNGAPGTGVAYNFTATDVYDIDGSDCPGGDQFTLVLHRDDIEYYTKVKDLGLPPYDCYENHAGITICAYAVEPWCSNTNDPIFQPIGVNDWSRHNTWYTLGTCAVAIIDGDDVYLCIPLVAIGSSSLTKSPGCDARE